MVKGNFAKVKRYANNIKGKQAFREIKKMGRFFIIIAIVLLVTLTFSDLSSSVTEVIDETVASIGNEVITRSELEENIQIFKIIGLKGAGRYTHHELERVVLYQMIDNLVLMQEAEKGNINVSEAQIEEAVANFRQNLSNANFTKNLQEKNITLSALKKRIEREIIKEKIINKKIQELKPQIEINTERVKEFFASLKDYIQGEKKQEKIAEFYSMYPQELSQKGKVLLAQIVVEEKEEAEKILDKIKEGEDLSKLAAKHSLGPHAKQGGELGWFNIAELQTPLQDALRGLKEGELTQPIKSKEGYYRIFQIKKRDELSYQKWEKKIEDYLSQKEIKESLNSWLSKLREKYFIQIMDQDLRNQWVRN